MQGIIRMLKAGALYFAVVFGAGFVLGTIRTLWVVPRLGARTAELIESPVMLAVSIVAARWVVKRLSIPYVKFQRLGMGLIALCLMLIAEFALVMKLRGMTIGEYLANRDPVSGTVYYALLGVFAVLPALVVRR